MPKKTVLPLVLGSAKGYAFYTIYCPVYSDVQRASTLDGASDYRTGISIQSYKRGFEIGITSIFSKTLIKTFISNTSQKKLDKLIKEISSLSSECLFATWASKQLLKSTLSKSKVKRTYEEFIFFYYGINEPIENFYNDLSQEKIDFKNWSKNIGCNPPSSGLGLVEGGRGAFLSLGGYFLKNEKKSMQEMIKLLILYLANFLPTDVKKGRNSNLRRTLRAIMKGTIYSLSVHITDVEKNQFRCCSY